MIWTAIFFYIKQNNTLILYLFYLKKNGFLIIPLLSSSFINIFFKYSLDLSNIKMYLIMLYLIQNVF